MSERIPEETETKIKILIVDDDKIIAEIFKDLISDEERRVDLCYDGLDAIENLQKVLYDLIIIDLVMPRVGGLEILKYVKKINEETIAIIITGHASLETAITAIKEGAYDYIRKPCSLDEIKIVIDNAIEKIKLNRENKGLLKKLEEAYHELIHLKKEKSEVGKIASVNFFPSKMPGFHYLYHDQASSTNCVDKLKALSSLKESGSITENEFTEFKKHLIKMISKNIY